MASHLASVDQDPYTSTWGASTPLPLPPVPESKAVFVVAVTVTPAAATAPPVAAVAAAADNGKDPLLARVARIIRKDAPKLSRALIRLFLDASSDFSDPAKFVDFVEYAIPHIARLRRWETNEGVALTHDLVVHTFRTKLKIPEVSKRETAFLHWLCDLYLARRLGDDQLGNLPYLLRTEQEHPWDPQCVPHIVPCPDFLWGHLMALTDMLQGMREAYAADAIHVMSRMASQQFLPKPIKGGYLVRLSNKELGSLVLSTCVKHIYLDSTFQQSAGIPLPPGISYKTQVVTYVGKSFVINAWTTQMLHALVSQHGTRIGCIYPMLGADKLATCLTPEYRHELDCRYREVTDHHESLYEEA